MISIIRRSTRRTYEQAVENAQRVPGLESELAKERGRADDSKKKHLNLEQLLEERDETIEELRTRLDSLRRAGDEVAAMVATGQPPEAAGRHAARTLLAHTYQSRLADTAEGRAALKAVRELIAPQTATFLFHNRRLQSVHGTAADAQAAAERQGVDPDGWETTPTHTDWQDLVKALVGAPWSFITLTVDETAPWTTPQEPLTSVYVLMADGLPRAVFSTPDAADSLVRMELEATPTPAAISRSSTRSDNQPSPVV
ncbi:hypothetical protein [Streptomyces sp. NPDC003688]